MRFKSFRARSCRIFRARSCRIPPNPHKSPQHEVVFFGSDLALPAVVVAFASSVLSLPPYLFGLWDGGHSTAWCFKGRVAYAQADRTMSPLGWPRPRPGTLSCTTPAQLFKEYHVRGEINRSGLRIFEVVLFLSPKGAKGFFGDCSFESI
jgi:hypothetical protein